MKPPKPTEGIEARIKAYMEAGNVTPATWAAVRARRQGKSAMLGMMYGTGTAAMLQSQALTIPREHPLEFVSGYTYIQRDPRFGGVPVYKVTSKVISEVMGRDKVPHTTVHYRDLGLLGAQDVTAVAWTRRGDLEQLSTAVATLIMLSKEVVVVRAFEP